MDVGVGHALGRADHARVKFGAHHISVGVHFHDRAHHQAIHLRIQRANAVRKLFRKHRHGAIGKINGGAAQARFAIERGAAANVMRDVRDVDLQLEMAVRQARDVHGVVEIARCFAVNGDDGQIAEIAPPGEFRLGHLLRRVARFGAELHPGKCAADDASGS